MTRIALVADRNTATCFELVGLSEVYPVEKSNEAEKRLRKLLENENLRIVLVS